MARRLWQVLAGALIGSVAVAAYLGAIPEFGAGGSDPLAESAPVALAVELNARENAALAAVDGSTQDRIVSLASAPPSAARDAELTALLETLAADDPQAAVELAAGLGLDVEILSRAFRAWADREPDAALATLATWQPPATRRAVALSVLPVLGFDLAGIERLAAIFPRNEAQNFRVDALAALAEHDLAMALSATLALDTEQAQQMAQLRIAEVMARTDPVAGLEQAGLIELALLRRFYRDRLLDDWAKLDPDSMLVWLESADLTELLLSVESFRALATHDPQRLFVLADRFGPWQRMVVQRAAIEGIAVLDPIEAYRRVRELPTNADTSSLITAVAVSYAEREPEAALAWASSLNPRSSPAVTAVLRTLAIEDPTRVTDFVIAEILDPRAANRGEMPQLINVLGQAMQSPEIVTIADRVAAHPDPRVRAQMETLLSRWPSADPETALSWVMRNPEHLSPTSAGNFGMIVADQNPELAQQALGRLPQDLRGQWIGGAARSWATHDFDAAERWVLAMPSGPDRDLGLAGLVQQGVRQQSIDGRLLGSFSTVEARTAALMANMRVLGSTNPELGRQLIEQHIADPQQRSLAQQQLEAGGRNPQPVFLQ